MQSFKKFSLALMLICLALVKNKAQAQPASPHLERRHGAIQLIVSGKPFTLISGELHNSTSSTPEYFDAALKNVQQMNVNSVIASIAWEQLEPEENHFDFTMVDHLIKTAHINNLKLMLLWFATWKNGESSYAPLWVKKNIKRFYRIRDKWGRGMSAISPFCQAAMKADARAFAALMQHIKFTDRFSNVVMVQVENEAGAFSDLDYGKEAQVLYQSTVPAKLVSYLEQNRSNIDIYLKEAWEANGYKTNGNWAELFGEKKLVAQHLFMTWHYASYINEVCRQGKEAYNIPMYVNAWQDHDDQPPGKYPNGGPVAKVLDIYRAAAPHVDFISPDIYLPNFREICDKYFNPEKKNPLFVPECERTNPGKAFYALGQDDGIGFAPFGIESLVSDQVYAQSNAVLKEILPLVTQYQGTGRMCAFLQQANEDTTSVNLGKYHISIKYNNKSKKSFGLIIQTGDQDYLIAGLDCHITFNTRIAGANVQLAEVLEGGFKDAKWYTTRQLNGDETSHNRALIVGSRSYVVTYINGIKRITPALAPIPVLDQELEAGLQTRQVQSPAVYKIKVFDLFTEGK